MQLKNNNDNRYSYGRPLSFENFNNSEKQIAKVYTSLKPIVCGTINDEIDNEQNIIEKNEKN